MNHSFYLAHHKNFQIQQSHFKIQIINNICTTSHLKITPFRLIFFRISEMACENGDYFLFITLYRILTYPTESPKNNLRSLSERNRIKSTPGFTTTVCSGTLHVLICYEMCRFATTFINNKN